MTTTQLLAALIPVTLLTISPGVDTLLVMRNTQRGGWRDGLVSGFGINSGLFVHALVSAVGLSVLLLQSAWAFSAIKLLGALYLIWLGWQSLRSLRTFTVLDAQARAGQFRPGRSLREGVLSNVLNPKAIVFYMAFLPQFANAGEPLLPQFMLIAAMHFTVSSLWLGLLTLLLTRVQGWQLGRRLQQGIQGATGVALIGFGVALALDSGRR